MPVLDEAALEAERMREEYLRSYLADRARQRELTAQDMRDALAALRERDAEVTW